MRTTNRAITFTVALLGGLTATVLPASASPSADHLPANAAAAIQRLDRTGVLSDADRQTIASYPGLAATVVDPALTTTSTSIVPADAATANSGALAGPGCWIGNHQVVGRYLLGGVAYRFNSRVDWCENSTAITSVHFRQGTFPEVNAFMEPHNSPIENSVTPVRQKRVTHTWKAAITNNPWIGPSRTEYPYVTWYLAAGPGTTDLPVGGIQGV